MGRTIDLDAQTQLWPIEVHLDTAAPDWHMRVQEPVPRSECPEEHDVPHLKRASRSSTPVLMECQCVCKPCAGHLAPGVPDKYVANLNQIELAVEGGFVQTTSELFWKQ
jgi:hypothetical protein